MDRTRPDHEIVFVHDGEPPSSADATFVALTPTAYDVLERAELHPAVVDDFGPRPALFRDLTDYYRWKHGWFRRLDQAARGGDGIVPLAAHLFHAPVDSVVAWSVLLRGTTTASHATAVRYVGATPDN